MLKLQALGVRLSFLLSALFYSTFAFSQDVQSLTLTYTPAENGYELHIPIKWKFINCYGEVHVTITRNKPDITSNAYIYNGKRYTTNELGADVFAKPECGLTDIMVDFYDGSYRVGQTKFGNVIDWFGGCFGQTYHITALLGLQDSDYKDKLAQLSLKNIRFSSVSSRDLGVESRIAGLEKTKSLESKLREADNALLSNNLDAAKQLYEEALKIDYTSSHAKEKIQEINSRLKEEKEKEESDVLKTEAKSLYDAGNYEAAKTAYEKVLVKKPDDSESQRMLETINGKLEKEREQREKERIKREKEAEEESAARSKKETAVAAAGSRKHQGLFWGKPSASKNAQPGSFFQNTNLMGLFKVEYDMWSLTGEPAHRFKFYWEWDDALGTGYPQYVSVLGDKVVHIADFKKYPHLLERWNRVRPLYIEVECDVLSFKHGDDFVASEGTILVIPEVLGAPGQEVDWSQPASPSWDELFPYTNYLKWDYFRGLGLYEEIEEYTKEFDNKVSWAKYAFEYSDDINFYQDHSTVRSNFLSPERLTSRDHSNYSSSAYIKKAIWPVEEMKTIIEEFIELEKRAFEEKLSPEDFWNTSENDEREVSESFWDTPDNTKTVQEVKNEQIASQNSNVLQARQPVIMHQREKYEALQNPFTITHPENNTTVTKNVVEVKGSVNEYFLRNSNKAFLHLNGVMQELNLSDGQFFSPVVLGNGENRLQLELQGNGFSIKHPQTIYYEGVDTDIRVTLTWDGAGDLDLRMTDPQGQTCSYSNRKGGAMILDVDNTTGYGPENISVIDGASGSYGVSVNNYSRGAGRTATVYIFKNEQLIETKTHTFSRAREIWQVTDIQL